MRVHALRGNAISDRCPLINYVDASVDHQMMLRHNENGAR